MSKRQRLCAAMSNRSIYIALLLAVAGALAGTTRATAVEFKDCAGCHESTLAEDLVRDFLHSPFEQGECASCHAVPETAEVSARESREELRVSWLGEAEATSVQHAFLLPGPKMREILVVDTKAGKGEFSRQEIAVPPLDDLDEYGDAGRPPAISGVHLVRIQQGAVLSATIGWQTDTITDGSVRYGEKEISASSSPARRLGRDHQVVLQNLRRNSTYQFVAVSRDLFGRLQESEPKSFSTAAPVEAPKDGSAIMRAGDAHGLVYDFHRVKDDYLLELTFDQPILAYVGSRGKFLVKSATEAGPHPGLSSRKVMSMTACLGCHQAHLHPLDIPPSKAGVVIPPELPTLPGGRVSCNSCHAPHGSEFYFHLRKPAEELCGSCHQKWVKEKPADRQPH